MKKLINLTKGSKLLFVLVLSFMVMSFDTELKERKVLNEKITLLLPSDFTLMDESTLLIKYPNTANRPTEVYTNDKGSINIAFNHTSNPISEQELNQVQTAIKQQLSATNGIEILKTDKLTSNNSEFLTIEFMSNAIDTKIYNKMFITVLDGKLLLGTFNCTMNDLDKWQPLSKQMISSIKK
ncbi:hypothetical protein [Penaeicola halotolerans]|uniref:hypothetical protein n=1 Tax=Penaeicola halotolerans TaxID=2793196 RepID=UPI001CF8EDC4|nr:hypothetical protein [Penaeicola halotolerans]